MDVARLQNCQKKTQAIYRRFGALRQKQPDKLKRKLDQSWSNWGFGLEALDVSARRLEKHGVGFIELHG